MKKQRMGELIWGTIDEIERNIPDLMQILNYLTRNERLKSALENHIRLIEKLNLEVIDKHLQSEAVPLLRALEKAYNGHKISAENRHNAIMRIYKNEPKKFQVPVFSKDGKKDILRYIDCTQSQFYQFQLEEKFKLSVSDKTVKNDLKKLNLEKR